MLWCKPGVNPVTVSWRGKFQTFSAKYDLKQNYTFLLEINWMNKNVKYLFLLTALKNVVFFLLFKKKVSTTYWSMTWQIQGEFRGLEHRLHMPIQSKNCSYLNKWQLALGMMHAHEIEMCYYPNDCLVYPVHPHRPLHQSSLHLSTYYIKLPDYM